MFPMQMISVDGKVVRAFYAKYNAIAVIATVVVLQSVYLSESANSMVLRKHSWQTCMIRVIHLWAVCAQFSARRVCARAFASIAKRELFADASAEYIC